MVPIILQQRIRATMACKMHRAQRFRGNTWQKPTCARSTPMRVRQSRRKQHVFLDCELYSGFRRPFFEAIDTWLAKVRETESCTTGWEHMDRIEAMQWIHHDTPLVTNPITALAGAKVRQAALSLHSKIQQERYATGRIHQAPQVAPMATIHNVVRHTHPSNALSQATGFG